MKFYHRLRTKLMLVFTLITLLPILVTGFFAIQSSAKALKTQALSMQQQQVMTLKDSIERFLATARSDLLFLTQSVPFKQYIGAREKQLSVEALEKARKNVEQEFAALSNYRKVYYQIRYLDETGQEIVRIDTKGGKVKIIAAERLQNKGSRYYFTDTMKQRGQQVFVSPLDLNREQGKVETPYKPVIRYGVKVYNSKHKTVGILITNIDAGQFLDTLGSARLVDAKGFFMHHPNDNNEWGSQRDLDTGYNLETELPTLNKRLLRQDGSINTRRLTLSSIQVDVPGSSMSWHLILKEDAAKVLAGVYLFLTTFTLILVITLVIALLIALLISGRITRPIEHLTEVADAISKGKLDTDIVEVDNKGEIGQLAKAFERLRVSMIKAMERLQRG